MNKSFKYTLELDNLNEIKNLKKKKILEVAGKTLTLQVH